uniref:Neurotransmitter-gated ion-channel transmembrane domain-containing protein n=1 Tax=Timema cristinae TaxID=61476 RepID=A0A7R9H079_TIMCR|nr:unnamed protein product [Timema cristinae]
MDPDNLVSCTATAYDPLRWMHGVRRNSCNRLDCRRRGDQYSIPVGVSATALLVGASGRSPDFYIPDNYNKNEAPNSGSSINHVTLLNGRRADVCRVLHGREMGHITEVSMDVAITRTWSDGRLIFNSTSSRKEGRLLLGSGDASKLWKPDLYVSNMRELNTIQYGGLDTTYLMVNVDKSVTQVLRSVDVCKGKYISVDVCKGKYSSVDVCKGKYSSIDAFKGKYSNVDAYKGKYSSIDAFKGKYSSVDVCKGKYSSIDAFKGKYSSVDAYKAMYNMVFPLFVTSGNSSTLRLYLTLDRELTPHLLETYLPTGLFVIISWGSFTVKPENVPGRMVLLVTNLLSLVTLFESVRNNSPAAMGIKCMDVWLVACILFIFLALVEYIAVLWKIRGPFFERKTSFIQNSDTPITYKNAKKIEATKEKVSYMCEFLRKCRKMLQYVYQTRPTSMWDPLDKISVFVFPFMFLICNAVYWPTYIIMRSQLDLPSVCTDE